jgi:hypothetical protein
MNKFSNLSKLFNEIELLESAGLYKAANVLHKKFVKEAQQDPADLPSTDQANQPDEYIYNKSGQKAPILYMLENNQFTPEEEERLTSTGKGTDINGEEWTYLNKTKVQTPQSSNTLGIGPSFPQVGNRQPKMGPTGLAQTPRTNIAPMSDPMIDQTDQDNNQIVDEDFLQKEIKRLADEFEDYIQNAILGRNVNNSLNTAKHNIDQVEKYLGPKYSQNIKDYAQAQLDIMRKRFADMYQKYYKNDNQINSNNKSLPILNDKEQIAVYKRTVDQIASILSRKNVPAAQKLAKDYQNYFSNPQRNVAFQDQVNRIFARFNQQSPFGSSVASQPEMSDEDGQTLTQRVNTNVQRNMQTSVAPSAGVNDQLFQVVSNFYTNRYGPQPDTNKMYSDIKADSAKANSIRYHIRASNSPNKNQLLSAFESKIK